MGTAFSTSLFGLSGSLILGFLDLQAGRAQNRFYMELENWLSSVTDVSSELSPAPVANSGEAVWADLAEAAIAGAAKRGARATPVVRITTDEYPTPARRPADSRLDLSRYERFAGAAPPDWRGALERCLDEMFP